MISRLMVAAILLVVSSISLGDVFDDYAYKHGLNANVLRSIASIESNLNPFAVNYDGEPFTKLRSIQEAVSLITLIHGHPHMVRVDRKGSKQPQRYFYSTQEAAKAKRAELLAASRYSKHEIKVTLRKVDIYNFDVGLMQINNRWHGHNFASLYEMFDIHKNLNYASALLKDLHKRHGSMGKAIAHYHSPTPERQQQYLAKFDKSYRGWEKTISKMAQQKGPVAIR